MAMSTAHVSIGDRYGRVLLLRDYVKLSEYDLNIDYPEGTEFILDDEVDMSKFDIPNFLNDKDETEKKK